MKKLRTKTNNGEDIRDPQDPSMPALEAVLISRHSSPARKCSSGPLVCKIISRRSFSEPHPAEAEIHQESHTNEQLALVERRRAPKKKRTQESAIMVIVVVVAAAAKAVDN